MVTAAAELTSQIPLDRAALTAFCAKWGVTRLELFGSVLRDDFGPNSDVDVMVSFAPGHQFDTGFELVEMQWELETLLSRAVDLVTRDSIESSYNEYRRASILSGARDVIRR